MKVRQDIFVPRHRYVGLVMAGFLLVTAGSLLAWNDELEVALGQSSRFDFPLTALEVVLLGRLPHCRGREGERDHDIVAQALSAVDAIDLARDALLSAYGIDVDILPDPLGMLLYPRTAVALVGDRSA